MTTARQVTFDRSMVVRTRRLADSVRTSTRRVRLPQAVVRTNRFPAFVEAGTCVVAAAPVAGGGTVDAGGTAGGLDVVGATLGRGSASVVFGPSSSSFSATELDAPPPLPDEPLPDEPEP